MCVEKGHFLMRARLNDPVFGFWVRYQYIDKVNI